MDEIYDTTFAADFTTIEGVREFLARLENGGPFPMFTSCCPCLGEVSGAGEPPNTSSISPPANPPWRCSPPSSGEHYQEEGRPGRADHLPHRHHALHRQENGGRAPPVPPQRKARRGSGAHHPGEIINMIKGSPAFSCPRWSWRPLTSPFGLGSGSATIYGTTGGVAEAVVRHCMPDKSRNTLRALEYSPPRKRLHPGGHRSGGRPGDPSGCGPRPDPCPGAVKGRSMRATLTTT